MDSSNIILNFAAENGKCEGVGYIPDAEYIRLINEMCGENDARLLHMVDIASGLTELRQDGSLSEN